MVIFGHIRALPPIPKTESKFQVDNPGQDIPDTAGSRKFYSPKVNLIQQRFLIVFFCLKYGHRKLTHLVTSARDQS